MYPGNLPLLRCPECGELGILDVLPLEEAADGELVEALLTCQTCGCWFRLEAGIADLVREGLREVDDDRAFLGRHAGRVPEEYLQRGMPFGLAGYVPDCTEADSRIVEEGRHWGRFMRRFWDVGDRAIFDLACRGSHPPFFVAGVLERDDRDADYRWANFPRETGDMLFGWLDRLKGLHGLDIGCGGGQFGLVAARQGVAMIGFDPSFEEVCLARLHARQQGITNIDYVRGEPANPPFAPAAFHLLMAKDSLHHVPDLERIFPAILALLRPDGYFVCHEHVAKAPLKEALMNRFRPRAIEKIRSRYAKVEIPGELLRDSANEDVSADAIRPLLARHFDARATTEDLYLAREAELLVHFAFGKRRWFSRPFFALGMVIEKLFLALGDRQHFSFVGTPKQGSR